MRQRVTRVVHTLKSKDLEIYMRNKVVKQLRKQAKALFTEAEYATGQVVGQQYKLDDFCIKAIVKGMKRNYMEA